MAQMQAKERLYLTADKKRLVAEGDKRAATLYAVPGDFIPDSAVALFGLVDGALKGSSAGGGKEKAPAPNKEKAPGEDKSAPNPPVVPEGAPDTGASADQSASAAGTTDPATGEGTADDLVLLKGVGEKTAALLVSAGLTNYAAIASVDPASPPAVAGLSKLFKWAEVVADAKAKLLSSQG